MKVFTGSSDKIANALASITPGKLSYMEFGRLPEGCKNEILKIAPSLDGDSMPDASDFVLTISRTLEILLREKIYLLNIHEYLDKSEAVKLIESKLNGKIPEGLLRVSDWYYLQAIAGKNSTLGAYALVWFAHSGREEIAAQMLGFISEIARLRGHGNSISLIINADKLKDLREQLFMFIKQMED